MHKNITINITKIGLKPFLQAKPFRCNRLFAWQLSAILMSQTQSVGSLYMRNEPIFSMPKGLDSVASIERSSEE